jgi:hypothetical protein
MHARSRRTSLLLSLVTATLVACACGQAPASPSLAVSVGGTWWLADRSQGSYVLEQSSSVVTGRFRSPISNSDWPLEDTVTDRTVVFTKHMAYYDGTLTGELSADGRTLTGRGVSVRTADSPNPVPEPYSFVLYREP